LPKSDHNIAHVTIYISVGPTDSASFEGYNVLALFVFIER